MRKSMLPVRVRSRMVAVLGLVLAGMALLGLARAAESLDVSVVSPERSFSPNGDQQEDAVSVTYCLSEPANMDIWVASTSGTRVRTIEDGVSHAGGSCEAWDQSRFDWDGKDDHGQVVPDGRYAAHLKASSSQAESGDVTVGLEVDTRIPGSLTSPAPGATLSGTVAWAFTPTAGFELDRVSVSCQNGAGLASSEGPGPDARFTGELDTTGCSNGDNRLQAQAAWTDRFGQPHGWSAPAVPVTVANPPQLTVLTAAQSFSPDGDDQEDTVSVAYCLSQPARVDVWVASASGTRLRTIEDGAAHEAAGCGSPTWVGWDGKDGSDTVVADGRYTVHLLARNAAGDSGGATLQLRVDTRKPGQLTTPAAGAVVSGSTDWAFTPTAGFHLDRVWVSCQGGAGGQVTADSPGPDGRFTGELDTSECSNGDNRLQAAASWTDEFGQYHGWSAPAVPVTVRSAPQLSVLSGERYFSPDGDDQEDIVLVGYCLSQSAQVDVWVADAAGTRVRTIQDGTGRDGGPCTFVQQSFSWDGRDGDGRVVADGVYTAHLMARNSAGDSGEVLTRIGVDTRTPGALTAPSAGAVVSGMVAWAYTPAEGFHPTTVSVSCQGGRWATSEAPGPDGRFTGELDTTGCTAGDNQLQAQVTWTDPFGGGHTWSAPAVPVTVRSAPELSVLSAERYFSPDGDDQEDTISVAYCLSQPAEVHIRVADAAGATVRTIEDGVAHQGGPCNFVQHAFDWDGRDDGGRRVADGVYSAHLTAVNAGGQSGEVVTRVGVDTRSPGALIRPAPGDTLAGLARFVFQPSPGFTPDRVDLRFDTGGGASIHNASSDGLWRTSMYTGSLGNGPATVGTTVSYHDPFGASHSVNVDDVPVVIDDTALPLAVSAEPAGGPAPLTTTFHITTSDPQARSVRYTVDFGDGTPGAGGTIDAPYPVADVGHTYRDPGAYRAVVTVTNSAGASSTQLVEVSAAGAGNTAPTATLDVSGTSGVVPLPVEAAIAGADPDGDPLSFSLDFGDGSAPLTGSLPHAPVTRTYDKAGTYLIRLAVGDGRLTAVKTATVVVGPAEPLAANAGDDQAAVVDAPVHLDGTGSRPPAGIESYRWDLGDGSTATGATVDHTYTAAGTYTAKLTVRAGGRSESDSAVITVAERPAQRGLVISARDQAGAPVDGAALVVMAGDGTRHAATTGPDGSGTLQGLTDGAYTVYAWRQGYLPAKVPATVTAGAGEATVVLKAGQVATASLTSTPLTQEQVVAAGIDPTDPDNQHVYEFKIYLSFEASGKTTVVTGYTSTGGFPLRPSVEGGGEVTWDGSGASFGIDDGYQVSMSVSYVHDQPQLLWLVIPGKATWLKEFFSVQMMVTNLADPDFTLENGSATLAVPEGLSLAPTAVPQSPTAALDSIPGGQSRAATWVLRGDTEGRYDLSASYAGTLEPFGDTVTIQAATDRQLHVWGGSALELVVDTDDTASEHYPYHVTVGLKNVADVPVYNPTIELLKEGKKNYIYQPREQLVVSTAELAPGDTLAHDYILIPTISGTLNLERSFVSKTAGDVELPASITSHPAAKALELTAIGLKDKALLVWEPVQGATGYEIFSTPDPETDFPAQPVQGMKPVSNDGSKLRAVVPLVPAGTQAWYAVSPTVNGRPLMRHPLTPATSTSEAASPTVEAKRELHTCGATNAKITFTFNESYFELSAYEVQVDGAVVDAKPLKPLMTDSATTTIDIGAGQKLTVTARARNSENDWGPPWTSTVDTECERETAVVVAMGLGSSLRADGSNVVSPDCHRSDDVDEFNKQAATDACDAPAGDTKGNLISYLRSKGYVDGEGRQSHSRTLLEFSYNGAEANRPACQAEGVEPVLELQPYTQLDTVRYLVEDLALYRTSAAARYVDALRDYSYCWKKRKGRELTFHVIGHSEGGYEAMAMAYEAAAKAKAHPGQGYEGLISSIVTVDGALHPHVVLPELDVGGCWIGAERPKLPADVAKGLIDNWLNTNLPGAQWAKILANDYPILLADWLWSGQLIRTAKDAGTDVAAVTNQFDGCLSPNATLNDAADYSEMFRVRYGTTGKDGHSALLTSHKPPTHEPGYPLAALLDSGYVPKASILPPRSLAKASSEPSMLAAAAETGRLVGRVVHPETGAPVAAGQVVAYGSKATMYTSVQEGGAFSFDALPVGNYHLFVQSFRGTAQGAWVGGPTLEEARAFGVDAGTTDVGDVAGAALKKLTVKLTGADGKSATDGYAVLVDDTGRQAAHGTADADGNVTLAVPSGTYNLGAASPTTKPVSVPVDLTGPKSVELKLNPAAVVTATVKDDKGAPLPGVTAALYSGEKVVAAGFTGVDGTYTFGGLDPGDYTVRLYEALDRFELPEVVLPVTAVVGDPAAGQVSYSTGDAPTGCTIVGTAGNDVLRGTPGDDVICGLEGDDVLYGSGGDDRLLGGEGKDRLSGGSGNDALAGEGGDDRLLGGSGDDELTDDAGNDSLSGEAGDDRLTGGAGNDRLAGGHGDDRVDGGDGNDRLNGGADADRLAGGGGDDRLAGGRGDDHLDGGDGDDRLVGESGADELAGGNGNDRLDGGDGSDRLDGGEGDDRVIGGSGDDQLLGGAGTDSLSGGRGNDRLDGGDGTDSCHGDGGRNELVSCEA